MGNVLTQVADSTLGACWARPSRIMVLGLDGAGKTTLLNKLTRGEAVATRPTIGFIVETFRYRNVAFTTWDIGGSTAIRLLWKCYTYGSDAVIYVVDATDKLRMEEAAAELHSLFEWEELKDAKLLVFANKQDLPDCMSVKEIEEKLNLPAVTKNATHIVKTVVADGVGVYEGLSWLCQAITEGS